MKNLFWRNKAYAVFSAGILVITSTFAACKPVKEEDAKTQALEEEKKFLSGKINRIYLAFNDSTRNDIRLEPFPQFSEGLPLPSIESLIRLRPFFLIEGVQKIAANDPKWPSRYAFQGVNYDTMASNAPSFNINNVNPQFDSKEEDSVEFTIVGCYNEQFFNETSKNIKERPLYGSTMSSHDANLNLGFPSARFQLTHVEAGMPYNERIRLADFPIIPMDAKFSADRQCKTIGTKFGYNTSTYFDAMKDYSDTLGPKFKDFLTAGASTLACGTLVGGPVISALKGGLQGASLELRAAESGTEILPKVASRINSAFTKIANSALPVKVKQVVTMGRNLVKEIVTAGRGFSKGIKLSNKQFLDASEAALSIAEKQSNAKRYATLLRSILQISKSGNQGRIGLTIKKVANLLKTGFVMKNSRLIVTEMSDNLGINLEDAQKLFDYLSLGTPEGIESATQVVEKGSGVGEQTPGPEIADMVQDYLNQLQSQGVLDPEMITDIAMTIAAIAVPMASCGVAAYEWLKIVHKGDEKHNFNALTNAIAASTNNVGEFLYESYFNEELKEIHDRLSYYNANPSNENLEKLKKYYAYINPHVIYAFNRMVQQDKLKTTIIEDVFSNDSVLENMKEMILEGIAKSGIISMSLMVKAYTKSDSELSPDEQSLVDAEMQDFDLGE